MKKILTISTLIFVVLLLTSCADVSQVQFLNPAEHVYGFWGGVWHGIISTPAFFGSLFFDDIAIYAVNNNGGWYDFGFIGGLGMIMRGISSIMSALFGNPTNKFRR